MEQLKPCPFCRSGAIIEREYAPRNFGNVCNVCGLEPRCFKSQDEANKFWNTRPIEDGLREQLEIAQKLAESSIELYNEKLAELEKANARIATAEDLSEQARALHRESVSRLKEALDVLESVSVLFGNVTAKDRKKAEALAMYFEFMGRCGR